ncbi:MAG TPA: GNAT family N-acetyltransferase [Polyangiaceae bacterium]|nr:GNAT family N-acetyltransferase [Polyangiaceae bacterium]
MNDLGSSKLGVIDPHSWQQRYRAKVSTPAAAVRAIRAGRRILIGSGAAEPTSLVAALVEYGDHLADNELVHLLTLGPAPYVRPEFASRFRHLAFFIGANVRDAVQAGRADFMPVFLSELPKLIQSRRVPIDVALIQVSPPDSHGYVSLGVSVDIVRAAVASASLVIAEVNPQMPRTHGDSFLSVKDIHLLVPVDKPVLELPLVTPDAVALAIGEHVAGLIPNGATLQTGIGPIPSAALAALVNHENLGIHTEMLSDAVIDLVERGVINGKKKTLLPGKIVTSFVMGTRRLYDWVDNNPAIELRPSDFTNDPLVIARNERMIAINSALAVDLTGQVAADTVDGQFFSGIGGQVDFVRGAARSPGGKPVIALPSTARKGQVSRIQATFEAGAGVVTSRGDVHYVVTEYGVADLWGKSVRERAMALIDVAHPDHRRELLSQAKAKRYVFQDQREPRIFSRARSEIVTLPKGHVIHIRPLRVTDERLLQDLFYRLSDQSTYQRFLAHKSCHPHEEISMLADFDDMQNAALVATGDEDVEAILAIARYDADPDTGLAEVALVVRDEWQGRGVGTALFVRLIGLARAQGVRGFTAQVLASNGRMLRLFRASGLPIVDCFECGVHELTMSLEAEPPLA